MRYISSCNVRTVEAWKVETKTTFSRQEAIAAISEGQTVRAVSIELSIAKAKYGYGKSA